MWLYEPIAYWQPIDHVFPDTNHQGLALDPASQSLNKESLLNPWLLSDQLESFSKS